MEFNGVYHQAYDNYCYPINENELIINIKTGYDVQRVFIILGESFFASRCIKIVFATKLQKQLRITNF